MNSFFSLWNNLEKKNYIFVFEFSISKKENWKELWKQHLSKQGIESITILFQDENKITAQIECTNREFYKVKENPWYSKWIDLYVRESFLKE